MLPYLLAAEASPNSILFQYGALGVLAAVTIAAVIAMWKRQEKVYDENIKAERARADRLETELIAQNKLIASELSGNLVRATEAVKEATDVLRRRDR